MDSLRGFVLNTLCDGLQTPNILTAELTNVPSLENVSKLDELVKSILNEFCAHGLAEMINA